MKRGLFLCHFLFKSQLYKWEQLFTTALFYAISFFMLGMLLAPLNDAKTFWALYLLIQNFGVAFLLKDAFTDDFTTTRLHALMHQPLPLEGFLSATILSQTLIVLVLHLMVLPLLGLLFPQFFQDIWPQFILWQTLSSGYLVILYLLGAAFSLKSQLGGFLNLVIGLPLLVPWFLFSYEYLLYQDYKLLLSLAALIAILLPITIMAQRWILRSVTVFLA
jgi:ABC-type transport system involved in cytochrome c biogenesis permease component